ncbi:MAG: PAS domain-containing protein [Alphaproteobacteria bacterium]|nr:PAS domain-containing protein [Alphaproteobacteria bacterium]
MRKTLERSWTSLRDPFSSAVLGTTSSAVPGLQGGLSRPARLAATAVSLGLGLAVAVVVGPPPGVLFLFPALMIAGLFGGVELGLIALAICIALSLTVLPVLHPAPFIAGATLQTLLALGLRELFRESRRWGVRYRKLLSAISSAVTVSDSRGRIERPHPELSALIGMPWPDYEAAGWLNAVHPDDRKLLAPEGPAKDLTMHRAEMRLKDPRTGEWRWHLMRAVPLLDAHGKVEEWVAILTDVHERKLAGEQQALVIGEARHRLKNLITIIESLAKSSRPAVKDQGVETFLGKFLGRLHALSAAGDLALAGNYASMQTEEVVRATLSPFFEKETGRFTIGGPKLELSEATGGALALGLNELATNSIKYGALSEPGGRVAFTWTVTPEAGHRQVEMTWKETGGPPPKKPDGDGFGSRVIGFIPSREQNGSVTMDYPADGYVCRIGFTLPDRPRVKTLEAE